MKQNAKSININSHNNGIFFIVSQIEIGIILHVMCCQPFAGRCLNHLH